MKKYRIAMIGVGNISQAHHKMLSAVPERAEVIGMYDIRPEAMQEKNEKWGYRIFDTREALLAEKPDIAWVMTPVAPRPDIFKAAFEAGCHVFTEKPLALNNEDAQLLVKMAQDYDRQLCFGANDRGNAQPYTMAQLYFSGALGDLLKVYAHTYINRDDEFWAKKFKQPDAWRMSWDASGGRIFEFAIHLVNWVQWVGGEPRNVYGTHDAVSDALRENGLDDVVSAHIKFDKGIGVVETFMAPGCKPKMRRDMGILGTKGECWQEGKQIRVIIPGEERDELIDPDECANRSVQFLDALDNGETPLNDGAAALATTRICTAFNESWRTGQAVAL